jgi:hypothetical protein
MRADAKAMGNKRNVVLYLDKELVEKSKELARAEIESIGRNYSSFFSFFDFSIAS